MESAMSIKDRIEAAKAEEHRNRLAGAKAQERAKDEAKAFFKPVYDAFLEIEKEYGSGRGLRISVADYMCTIRPEKGGDALKLSCFFFRPNKITLEETKDFSMVPDPEIVQTQKELDSAKEAIDTAIKYVAKHIK